MHSARGGAPVLAFSGIERAGGVRALSSAEHRPLRRGQTRDLSDCSRLQRDAENEALRRENALGAEGDGR
jgi:hypothetical protein